MYVKVKNNQVIQYPYGYAELQAENPYTNFNGLELPYAFQGTEENLAGNILEPVVNDNTPPYNDSTQRLIAAETPVFENNQWVIKFSVVDKTSEELAAEEAQKAETVRAERNAALASSDWTQVADAPVEKAVWAVYRQELRDITKQVGFPWQVTWPNPPA